MRSTRRPALRDLGRILLLAASVVGGSALAVHAQDYERTIMGGPGTGTYIQIARDIGELAASCGLDVEALETEGGFENFLAVRKRPYTQFGMTQSDILEYLRTYAANDPATQNAAYGMRIALPLYDEEVQILARRDVEDFGDLENKRVGVGSEGSGTFLTASLMLGLTGVEPAERVSVPFDEMMTSLLDGDLDAFFFVAGAPTALLESPEIDGEAFHLLPVSDPTLQAVYQPATIPAGTYDYQEEAVETVAIKAVLMTFEYDPELNAYHRQACDAVSDVAHLVVTRLDELRETGHPKWNQIDLTDIPPGWEVGSCVTRGLRPDYEFTCQRSEPTAAAPAQGEAVDAEANRVYRQQICDLVGC